MTFSYIKDITYNMRNKANEYVGRGHDRFMYWLTKQAGSAGTGWDSSNFYTQMVNHTDNSTYYEDWELCRGERYVNNNLEWFMFLGNDPNAYGGCGQQVLNLLMNGSIYTDLSDGAQTQDIGTITLDRFRFPWYRGFEITFDIAASLDSTTHQYYLTEASYLTGVPTELSYAKFVASLQSQFSANVLNVKNQYGGTASTSGNVGTGFAVTMTVDGSSVTRYTVVRGDIDGNARVDTSDARRCMLHALDSVTLSGAFLKAADYDGNTAATTNDARLILMNAIMS